MKDDYPRTCIVTTHRPTVLTMCDRVYSIHDMQCTLLNDDEIEEITGIVNGTTNYMIITKTASSAKPVMRFYYVILINYALSVI